MSTKTQVVAESLAAKIRTGVWTGGQRLPGEIELAATYDVSRGTVRNALAKLQDQGLVETWSGAGSFVRYDGRPVAEERGWTAALAANGVSGPVRLIAFGRLTLPDLAEHLDLESGDFLVVDRTRSTAEGRAVSYECSRVPWRPAFERVLTHGLTDASLAATLAGHGMHAVRLVERTSVALLGHAEAELLDRPAGTAFLRTERLNYDRDGQLVEQVVSLLDPDHFTLERTYGAPRP